jgi:hypothetical protein
MRIIGFVLLTVLCSAMAPPGPEFRHHFITRQVDAPERPSPGVGSPFLADLDNDGDLDYAVLVRNRMLVWFENAGGGEWKRHHAGEAPHAQLGATAMDVDGDGWTDLVIGGYWFRNPQRPAGKEFIRYTYDSRIKTEIHDLTTADMDGDGRLDIVALGDREGCFWYSIPANPAADADWPRHLITDAVLDSKDDIHGGIAPRGVADLDGDGDPDVALTDRWLENQEGGTKWVRHPLPFGKVGPWGLSSRAWIVDLDGDGDNDIVVTDCDQKDSRAGWLENDGAKPPRFKLHLLPKTAPGVRGSFHSLAVADFDGDGDLDILTAEQEDTKILPEGAGPRFYLWENLDGKGGRFREHVILDARIGGHDLTAGDIDGDGDIDIAFKVWRQWTGNANGGRAHVGWLENRGGKR